MAALGLIEVMDRDGHARQSLVVHGWPVRIGRALDNDLVLGDEHVAAHHLTVESAADGLFAVAAETRNGLLVGRHRLKAHERSPLRGDGDPVDFTVGRTHLRLRLPGHALAPEVPLLPTGTLMGRGLPAVIAALLCLFGLVAVAYLTSDPDAFNRSAGTSLLLGLSVGAIWCAFWVLLSKTFTRQAYVGWHIRVFLFLALGLMALNVLLPLLSFMFSWAWVSDYGFVAQTAVVATALYFHLLAVEPKRRKTLRAAAFTFAVVGVLLSIWFNVQRTDQPGEQLYMSHLMPPALRVARPVPSDDFVNGLRTLEPALQRKAREKGAGEDDGPREEE